LETNDKEEKIFFSIGAQLVFVSCNNIIICEFIAKIALYQIHVQLFVGVHEAHLKIKFFKKISKKVF